jgi:hypothetical protein
VTNPVRLPSIPKNVLQRFSPSTKILAFDPPIERMWCRGRGERWPRRRPYYPLAVFGARNKLRVNTDFRASSRLTPREFDAICDFGAQLKAAPELPPDVMLVTPDDIYHH